MEVLVEMNKMFYNREDCIDVLHDALANAKRSKKLYWFNVIEWNLISLGFTKDEYKDALEMAKKYRKFSKLNDLINSL